MPWLVNCCWRSLSLPRQRSIILDPVPAVKPKQPTEQVIKLMTKTTKRKALKEKKDVGS